MEGVRRGAALAVHLAMRFLVGAAGLACLQVQMASGVVIDTLTGTGNTTAPADDPGWASVGVRGDGTGVYLGDGWVLTTARVGAGSIVLGSGTYAMLAGSGTTLGNASVPGKSATTDLVLYQLASPPTGLPSLTIASTGPSVGDAVTMIGAGRDRGSFTQWSVDTQTNPWTWTEVSSGGDAAGYQTLVSRAMRWGTNTTSAAGVWLDTGFGDTFSTVTTFTASGSPSTLAQGVAGDIGGAVFRKNGSTWELSGLMLTAAGYSGQPDPLENAIYGDETWVADLSFYRPQILAIVPEPSSMAILAPAIVCLTTALGRRLRARGRTTGRGCREGPGRPVSS
ncbi:MAG: hypothetical protein ACKOTB_13865 [Planctomycetia bacterium]